MWRYSFFASEGIKKKIEQKIVHSYHEKSIIHPYSWPDALQLRNN